jgi:hypothetical protein
MSAAKTTVPKRPRGRPRKHPLKVQPIRPESPPQQQPDPAAAGGAVDSSSDPFLSSTAGIPDTIEGAADPYAGRQAETVQPEVLPPAPALTEEMVRPAIEATFGLIGIAAARAVGDDCVKLTDEEKSELGKAWTPLAMWWLPQLLGDSLSMWAGPILVTGAVVSGKTLQVQVNRAKAAQRKPPQPTPSTQSSESGNPEKPPSFAQDFG